MKVNDCMSSDVRIASPSDTIRQAAQTMKDIDAGVLPVGENDRLVGMITDRDIAVRAVADGRGPDTPIRDVMSGEAKYCFDDEELTAVERQMGELQLRRLPVLNRSKRLVGIISLGDIAKADGAAGVGKTLGDISQQGGLHHT